MDKFILVLKGRGPDRQPRKRRGTANHLKWSDSHMAQTTHGQYSIEQHTSGDKYAPTFQYHVSYKARPGTHSGVHEHILHPTLKAAKMYAQAHHEEALANEAAFLKEAREQGYY